MGKSITTPKYGYSKNGQSYIIRPLKGISFSDTPGAHVTPSAIASRAPEGFSLIL